MSVEAMAWAFRQKLPPKPKIVLLALADQTDEATGRVCYGRTDIKHIAQKCSVGERSLYRYLAALIRNGYAIRESGKERGQESLFWLCLDRRPTELKDWRWSVGEEPTESEADDDPAGPQDVEEGSANLAEGETTQIQPEIAQIGRPPLPQDGRPRLSGRPGTISARARGGEARSFSKGQQDLERESAAIEKAAASQNTRAFVIEGTRAWRAWIDYRRKRGQVASMPTCQGTGDHANKRGWWLPSLFPPSEKPSSTGPPLPNLPDEDSEAVANF